VYFTVRVDFENENLCRNHKKHKTPKGQSSQKSVLNRMEKCCANKRNQVGNKTSRLSGWDKLGAMLGLSECNISTKDSAEIQEEVDLS